MTMTREGQIIKIGAQFAIDETDGQTSGRAASMRGVLLSAFRAGAQWADQHPHWIPVEERLPEVNTAPLVRMDLTDKFGEETILYDVVVFDGNGFHTSYKVTHWMEIVPPRKEG